MEKYKAQLLQKKEELERRINSLADNADFGSDVDGFEEETDETEEIGNTLAIRQSLEERLENISEALRKMDHGEYGVCESCGGKIEEEILDIDPESKLCKACKKAGKE